MQASNFIGEAMKHGAHVLCDDSLSGQWLNMRVWLWDTPDVVLQSPFCRELAWCREVHYELVRRGMLTVN